MNATELLTAMVSLAPVVLIHVVGIVLAVVRWQRHPLTSLLYIIGATVMLMASASFAVLPRLLQEQGGLSSMMMVFSVVRLIDDAGLAMLVAAIFVERAAVKSV